VIDPLVEIAPLTATCADQAEILAGSVLDGHTVTPLDSDPIRFSMRSAHVGPVGLERIEYGGAVSIASSALEYFHLVQIPLRGRSVLHSRGKQVSASSTIATLPPAHDDFEQRWENGSAHLLVYVADSELRRVRACVEGDDVSAFPCDLPTCIRLGTAEGQAFLRSVGELERLLRTAAHRPVDYALRIVSELMVIRLLDAANPVPAPPSVRGEHVYRTFVELAEAHACDGLGVVEIAQLMNVPLRTIQDHVRAVADCTPTDVLHEIRLRRAHRRLVGADPHEATVSAIAAECGFTHLGRFAADYRRTYGQTPAKVLQSA